jgi:hypothetical protein
MGVTHEPVQGLKIPMQALFSGNMSLALWLSQATRKSLRSSWATHFMCVTAQQVPLCGAKPPSPWVPCWSNRDAANELARGGPRFPFTGPHQGLVSTFPRYSGPWAHFCFISHQESRPVGGDRPSPGASSEGVARDNMRTSLDGTQRAHGSRQTVGSLPSFFPIKPRVRPLRSVCVLANSSCPLCESSMFGVGN